MPLRCCIVCRAEKSLHLQLQYCAACKSALYCSEACQKQDWRKHKKICKLLNVGHGDMQVRTPNHTRKSIAMKESFESEERSLDEEDTRFFKLFEESTEDGSRAAARKMKEIAKRQTKDHHKFLLLHSLHLLLHSDSKMLSWPNSPLLVLLQFVDPSELSGDEDAPLREGLERSTPLHLLASYADTSDYSTHVNQLILAKQLIEHGANVNAVSIPHGSTPLHRACYGGSVTNLDFVEILLKAGADPNYQNLAGMTPLMCTVPDAPGAAKFLLKWSTTDVNITTRSGASLLAIVRVVIADYTDDTVRPENPDKVQHQFQQWHEIEGMLVPLFAPRSVEPRPSKLYPNGNNTIE
jgi:hypothetical protein